MIVMICQYVAGAAVVIGSAFSLLAAIGLLRFPDIYMRLHAAAKTGIVGAGFVLLGVALAAFDPAVSLRAIGGIVFLVLTSPIAAHLLSRAAYLAGVRPTNITVVNDLAKESPKEQ